MLLHRGEYQCNTRPYVCKENSVTYSKLELPRDRLRSGVLSFVCSISFVRFRSFDFFRSLQQLRQCALTQLTRHSFVIIIISSAKLLSVHYMKVYSGFFIYSHPLTEKRCFYIEVGHMKRTCYPGATKRLPSYC